MTTYDPSEPVPRAPDIKTGPDYLDENPNQELVDEGMEVAEEDTHESSQEGLLDPDPELTAADQDLDDAAAEAGLDAAPETAAMQIRRTP
ncbi:hypothetical protein [Luteolibacter sp. LG18]|uniref:hypothetical protein n=1 Tax=Luteolibacter sp. LG18 TaxID=2819286 RepID=UPI002B31EB5A|nr:hypothetical protein llg_28950 [Luteolibacter sp. LG18]